MERRGPSTAISGARDGPLTGPRRLLARAVARDLAAFVVPDARLARIEGLDVDAAGLVLVETPRHATVLLVIGPIPDGLAAAAAVVYAQMPRPRTILAVGVSSLPGLPEPDVVTSPDQNSLRAGVTRLRRKLVAGAYSSDAVTFEIAAVRTRIEFVCRMHPEVVRDRPGSCPICGMDLVPRDTAASLPMHGQGARAMGEMVEGTGAPRRVTSAFAPLTCPMHPEVEQSGPGVCPRCGMRLVPQPTEPSGSHGATHVEAMDEAPAVPTNTVYDCPMHPNMVTERPGNCPICGMRLGPREPGADSAPPNAQEHGHEYDAETSPRSAYTCPMHPQIVASEPGRCPICGMNLVPVAQPHDAPEPAPFGSTGHAGHGSEEGRASRIVWATPDPVATRDGRNIESGAQHQEGVTGATVDAATDQIRMSLGATQHAPVGHPAMGGGESAGRAGLAMDDAGQPEHSPAAPEPSLAVADGQRGAIDHGAMDLGEPTLRAATMSDYGSNAAAIGHAAHLDHLGSSTSMDHPATGHGPVDQAQMDHAAMGHAGMDHSVMNQDGHATGGFMSMVAMTKDLPRSPDGLPMEWIEAPFGPLFPGLPAGLALTFTLDGDGVERAALTGGTTARGLDATWAGPAATFSERLARLDPLAPVAYRLLALRALEATAGLAVEEPTERGRIGALERERAASHLGWLADFVSLLGATWLARRAAALHLAVLRASDAAAVGRLRPQANALVRGVERTPLLRRRLTGIGVLPEMQPETTWGPLARSVGIAVDARAAEPLYGMLGFAPAVEEIGDALSRLRVRLTEIARSLDLVAAAGSISAMALPLPEDLSGIGTAAVETPRGLATLSVGLAGSQVTDVRLNDRPQRHAALVSVVAEGVEVGDALIGVASLDLSPWEVDR